MFGKTSPRKGTTSSEETKLKMKASANHILPDGKTVAEKRNQKTIAAMTPEQKSKKSIKGAETQRLKDNFRSQVATMTKTNVKSGRWNIWKIYNTDDNVVFEGIYSEMVKWCGEHNGSHYAFQVSAKAGGVKLYPQKGTKKYRHFKGFYCLKTQTQNEIYDDLRGV